MTQTFLILLGLVVVLVLAVPKGRAKAVGICKTVVGRGENKNKRKEKIIELLKQKGELSNVEVREALGVSSRTVVRYMNQLEKQGKVEQVGDTGHYVHYRLLNQK